MNSDSSLADWFSLWLDKAVKAPSLLSYDQAEWRDLEEIVLSVISDHETSDTTHYPKCHLTWMVVENFFSREWKRNHLKYRKYAVRIRKSVGRFMSPFMPVVIISFPIKLNLLISDFFFFLLLFRLFLSLYILRQYSYCFHRWSAWTFILVLYHFNLYLY